MEHKKNKFKKFKINYYLIFKYYLNTHTKTERYLNKRFFIPYGNRQSSTWFVVVLFTSVLYNMLCITSFPNT